jgi:hypothetical protein
MGEAEFAELMGLVVGTVRRLFKAAECTGFESAIFKGIYNGIAFKVWWTWYSFVNGLAGPCQRHSGSQSCRNRVWDNQLINVQNLMRTVRFEIFYHSSPYSKGTNVDIARM